METLSAHLPAALISGPDAHTEPPICWAAYIRRRHSEPPICRAAYIRMRIL